MLTANLVHHQFEVLNSEGEKIRGDVRYMPTGAKKPVLIFLHGFKGFKDWGPFPLACERFAEQSFVTISFNFSHNGVADQFMEFTELDRFANNTISQELADVHDVMRELTLHKLPVEESEINIDHIGIVGHSRGAGMAILAGAHFHEVRAVSAWASVSRFDRFTPRQKEKWMQEGYLEVMNQRTGQRMRMNSTFLTDLDQHREKLDIVKAAHTMTEGGKQLQLIAASEDLTAPPKESQEIFATTVKNNSELHIIEKTGHTFGTEHPFRGTTPAFEQAMALTIDFFKRHFAHLPPG